ncbi:MAG: patatin-like phospholipase family protein [Proteobacteria bacterium]|nr:patatin-like phospholipase family protein [Pseudomonadota bacterium]
MPRTALILSGGGARAAYQVGVLAAIRDMLPEPQRNPFPILCGTSAGAINAASLATAAENFSDGVTQLLEIWRNFHASAVYRSDALGIGATGARWLAALLGGWLVKQGPRALLDNSPLRQLLTEHLDFSRIDKAIANQALHCVSLTCSGYNSGQSVSFFQGRPDLEPWQRSQRFGAHVKLDVDHLMASSAIPFIFPAVKINREYFGDGSMRQVAPISPAIHLGADKILVVGAGRMSEPPNQRQSSDDYPSLAQIAGHALSSIFLDSLSVDLERIKRINKTLSLIPEPVRQEHGITLHKIDVLVIAPSERLDHIAARHANSLPWPVRALFGNIGAMNKHGGALTSYLLFEPPYTRALIDLGYRDAQQRRDEVLAFLEVSG